MVKAHCIFWKAISKVKAILMSQKFILIAKDAKLCEFEMDANTTVYIFGGEPFPEERYIHWNFVNSDKQVIEQAKHDWKDQKFPKVPGEQNSLYLQHL
jgi:redox-sensitive bicupin YhaK (pirin superfamily)